jgi:ferritin
MISQKMQEAFAKQINEEMYSSYLYLSMSAYFETANLRGFANWMKVQAYEELFHSMKFYTHIVERGGAVKLLQINEPKHAWNSPVDVFEESLQHEKHITKCIDDLMNLAIEQRDHAGRNLLNWFVDEQVEEESNFTEILEKLKMIGDHNPLLLMQDKEMSVRTTTVDVLNPMAAPTAA